MCVLQRKCDMYWPAGGRGSSAEFGGIHVTLLYEDVRAAYTVRHLRARSSTLSVSTYIHTRDAAVRGSVVQNLISDDRLIYLMCYVAMVGDNIFV